MTVYERKKLAKFAVKRTFASSLALSMNFVKFFGSRKTAPKFSLAFKRGTTIKELVEM